MSLSSQQRQQQPLLAAAPCRLPNTARPLGSAGAQHARTQRCAPDRRPKTAQVRQSKALQAAQRSAARGAHLALLVRLLRRRQHIVVGARVHDVAQVALRCAEGWWVRGQGQLDDGARVHDVAQVALRTGEDRCARHAWQRSGAERRLRRCPCRISSHPQPSGPVHPANLGHRQQLLQQLAAGAHAVLRAASSGTRRAGVGEQAGGESCPSKRQVASTASGEPAA